MNRGMGLGRRGWGRGVAGALSSRGRLAVCGAFALALLAGCATRAPAQHLVALPPAPSSASQPTVTGVIVTLRRVTLPEYLQSRDLRFRDGAAGIVSWPGSVWAERVEIGATRELAQALQRALPAAVVCDNACADVAQGRQVLAVDVSRLDIDRAARRLDGELRWTLLDPRAPQAGLRSAIVTRSLPLDDDSAEAAARALSALLGVAADEVAKALAAGVR